MDLLNKIIVKKLKKQTTVIFYERNVFDRCFDMGSREEDTRTKNGITVIFRKVFPRKRKVNIMR